MSDVPAPRLTSAPTAIDAQRDGRAMARAERHYSRLRARLARWLAAHRMPGLRAELLLLLPDLFMLLIRLLRDPRIDRTIKTQLLAVSAYIISPIDLVPDLLLPVGLADDTVALAFALSRVVALLGPAGEDVLREHWDGRGDVLDHIRRVVRVADRALNSRLAGTLRARYGGRGAARR